MPLQPGDKLGPYEIIAPIGAGGFGEVYKARDARLGRTVAIKVMPAHIAARADLRERFEREARAVSGLSHPHICALFDVGIADGVRYMVLEHLEGEPLSARLSKGALPLEQVLLFAMQLADALDRAHRKGVVHRDVKPSNVMVTRDGIKVLDFGLAKSLPKPGATEETINAALTEEGGIVGTLQYMAPELFEGKEADERSDIFGFGCVLYEMVTGKRVFDAKTRTGVIAAVQGAEAPLMRESNPLTPLALEKVVRRCLAKDPENRYRSLHDLLLDLRSIGEWPEAPVKAKRPSIGWVVAAVAAGVAAGAGWMYFRAKPLESPLVRLNLTPPQNAHFSTEVSGVPHLAISPDGKQVVFAAMGADSKSRLWVRPLDSTAAQELQGTDDAIFPFWSADSRSVAFFANGKLKRIDASGGAAVPLAEAPLPRGGTWNENGVIVFSPTTNGPLWRVDAGGGAVNPVTKLDAAASETSHRVPSFLPDGKQFLYAVWKIGTNQVTIRVGSLDALTEVQELQTADSAALYSRGHLLFVRGSTLMARPFNATGLSFTGDAVSAASRVRASIRAPGTRTFSVSSNGWLVYAGGAPADESRLAWFSRSGVRQGLLGDPGNIIEMHFSPDRKKVAVTISEGGSNDIWIYDVQRGVRTRVTSDQALDDSPVWSPRADWLVFRSNRKGVFGIFRKPADGSGTEQSVYEDSLNKFPAGFSPDGRFLVYQTYGDPKTGNDIWVLQDPLGPLGQSKAFPFLQSEFLEQEPQFSPDGKWISYQSNESGRPEIYVAPFPGPGGRKQVSTAGGRQARWRPDGQELFFIGMNQRLMAARIAVKNGSLEVGKIEGLFDGLTATYDVSSDGQRILTVTPPEGNVTEPLTVVQNWAAGGKK